jgi:hypothetical protein
MCEYYLFKLGVTVQSILDKWNQLYPDHQPPLTLEQCGSYLKQIYPTVPWSKKRNANRRTTTDGQRILRRINLLWKKTTYSDLQKYIIDSITKGNYIYFR